MYRGTANCHSFKTGGVDATGTGLGHTRTSPGSWRMTAVLHAMIQFASLAWVSLLLLSTRRRLTRAGCRLPGDVKSPSQLWDLLEQEKSAQSDVPTNRFDISKWYHPNAKRHGSVASMGGYFLSHDDSFRAFDPSFFGINPLEAATMDPQQRKLLEVVYEALDSAGTTLRDVSGSQTACYVGAFTNDMGRILSRDLEYYPDYAATGTDLTILSNRINYVFNLKGPRLVILMLAKPSSNSL